MSAELTIAVPVPAARAMDGYANYFNTLSALGARGVPEGGDVDLEACDGLLLPGGWDLNPSLYGQENNACEGVDDALDALQYAALDAFVKAKKPVFGICRGQQLINVYFGGTLIQHLPQAEAHSRFGQPQDKVHGTRAEPESILRRLYCERFPVNSSHHQAVDTLGEGLRVTQYADDGVIEGLEHPSLPLFAVQWHPERMCLERARGDTVDGAGVFRWFLGMCKR